MYKRCFMLLLLTTLIFLAGCNIVQNSQISLEQETQKDKVGDEEQGTTDRTKGIKKIELILDANGPYWNEVKPISITDNKMIHDIMSMIEESKPLTDESKISKMSGMARKNNKLVITEAEGRKKEITFAYDTLYEVGYIEEDGRKVEPDYSFFRYMADLNEYTNPDTNIKQQVIQLFDKHN